MARPTAYYTEHEVDISDANPTIEYRDFPTYRAAEQAARRMKGYVAIIRRENIIDVTPPEDGEGIIWTWDDTKVWEA